MTCPGKTLSEVAQSIGQQFLQIAETGIHRIHALVISAGSESSKEEQDERLGPELTPLAYEWEVGETRPMSFRLPENCREDSDHLEIGFFDEADREHGFQAWCNISKWNR